MITLNPSNRPLNLVFNRLKELFFDSDGLQKVEKLDYLPVVLGLNQNETNTQFEILLSGKLFVADDTNMDFGNEGKFRNIAFTDVGLELVFPDSDESPWYEKNNWKFYIPHMKKLIAPRAEFDDWLMLRKWYEATSFKDGFRIKEEEARRILNVEENYVFTGIIERLGDRILSRENRSINGAYQSFLKLTPHYWMLAFDDIKKPFEVSGLFYKPMSRAPQTMKQMMNSETQFVSTLASKFNSDGAPDYLEKKDFYHENLAIVELIDVEKDGNDLPTYRINYTVDRVSYEVWKKQHLEWWFSFKYFKPTPNEGIGKIIQSFSGLEDTFEKPNESEAGLVEKRTRKPAGSPYGFNERDWEWVEAEWGKSNFLKIVFGFQWESESYNPQELTKNVRANFVEAIELYNRRNQHKQINYEFKNLAAGYGGHLFNEIARDIISTDIAIFDTSDFNSNVMIEMGVALTWGILVLPIKDENKKEPPSDISGQTWVNYRNSGAQFLDEDHSLKLVRMIEKAMAIKKATSQKKLNDFIES